MLILDQIKKWSQSGIPAHEIETLIEKLASIKLGQRLSKFDLYSKTKEFFDSTLESEIDAKLSERARGIPLQYITGEQQFLDHTYSVNSSVLIPRPETEGLVVEAIQRITKKYDKQRSIHGFELGIGAGVISIELLSKFLNLTMDATDLSIIILQLVQDNAKNLLGPQSHQIQRLNLELVNPLEVVPDKFLYPARYDFIISNPPYLMNVTEAQDQVRIFEPHSALFGPDSNPSFYYHQLANLGRTVLKNDGIIFFEVPHERAKIISKSIENFGYKTILVNDLNSRPRVLIAELLESHH